MDPRAVVAAAMIALAIGVNVPQRLAVSVCTLAWTAVRSSTAFGEGLGHGSANPASDRSLHWIVVSVLALAGGVATMLLPFLAGWTSSVRAGLDATFLWPAPMGLLPDTFLAFLTCAAPIVLLGVAWCGLHHLSSPVGDWSAGSTAWALIGGGASLALPAETLAHLSQSNVLLAGAALPVLGIPLLVAVVGERGSAASAAGRTSDPDAPTLRDRWPRLLRIAIVAIGGGGACVTLVWSKQATMLGAPDFLVPGIAAAAGGAGLLIAARTSSVAPSMAGLGVRGAIAGVLTALGTQSFLAAADRPLALRLGPTWVALLAVGYAVGYGRSLLLARVASRSVAGAAELSRFWLCVAITVLITGPAAIYFFGRHATLMMVALSLVALGGTLVIHDTNDSPRRRKERLGVVFACLSGMVLLALMNTPALGR